MSDRRVFVNCEKCGKRLIERLPNGMWRFIFGKGEDRTDPPVELLIHGKENAEIADLLFISKRTVETHRSRILSKLNCKSLSEVIVKYYKNSN